MNIDYIYVDANEETDWRALFAMYVDGKYAMECFDGEVEDNTLARNFNSVYKIPEIIKLVGNAVNNNELVLINHHNVKTMEDYYDVVDNLKPKDSE